MHAVHPDPRLVLAALVTLLLVVLALAAAPELGDMELSGGRPPVTGEPQPTTGPEPPPAWASDPLAPPALLR